MKVLLVNTWCHSLKTPNEPMGLCYLASFLRENKVEVRIIDMIIDNLRYEDLVDISGTFDVIGLAILVPDYLDDIAKFVARVKTEKNVVIAGAYEPTLNPDKCMKSLKKLDGIVIGEGEVTFLEIIKKIKNKQEWHGVPGVYTKGNGGSKRPLIADLDMLPYPARDYAEVVLGRNLPFQIYSSRGCYGACSFCSIYSFYAKQAKGRGEMWRCCSAERVVDEIKFLQKAYNVSRFSLTDDNFIGPKPKGLERARRFAELLIEQDIHIEFRISMRVDNFHEDVLKLLKRAGLNQVFSGAENGNQNVLDYFNKGITPSEVLHMTNALKKLGIDMQLGFIWFTDKMSVEEFENNIKFADAIGPEYIYHPGNSRLRFNSGTRLTNSEITSGFINPEVQRIFDIVDKFFNENKKLYEILTRNRFDGWGREKYQEVLLAYKKLKEIELVVMKNAIKGSAQILLGKQQKELTILTKKWVLRSD